MLLAGIAAGIFNKDMRWGSLSGGIGVGLCWLGLMLYGVITNNAYILLNQFGGLLGLEGIGWVLFLIILIIGMVLGALGGAIGSSVKNIIKDFIKNPKTETKTSDE